MASQYHCSKHSEYNRDCGDCALIANENERDERDQLGNIYKYHCSNHTEYDYGCTACRDENENGTAKEVALAVRKKAERLAETHKEFVKCQEHGKYIYVHGESAKELVINVNKKIAEGYEPLGPPNINTYTYGVYETGWSYLQFMLKSKNE